MPCSAAKNKSATKSKKTKRRAAIVGALFLLHESVGGLTRLPVKNGTGKPANELTGKPFP
jgi:hypothetical protein